MPDILEAFFANWLVYTYRAFTTLAILYLIYSLHKYRSATVKQMSARLRRESVEALAVAINFKDKFTAAHVRRVQIYAEGVAELMCCPEPVRLALHDGALLHDVGKIGVPEEILLKPGKLTREEFATMKLHTIIGAQIVSRIKFPYPLSNVVRYHHERWDGTGYPEGLKGKTIPICARILAVVDCYDALREDRPYRKGMSRQDAIDTILMGAGTHYDPEIVGHFLTHLPRFEAQIQAERANTASEFGIIEMPSMPEAGLNCLPAAGVAEREVSH